jgi:hypothetical protein
LASAEAAAGAARPGTAADDVAAGAPADVDDTARGGSGAAAFCGCRSCKPAGSCLVAAAEFADPALCRGTSSRPRRRGVARRSRRRGTGTLAGAASGRRKVDDDDCFCTSPGDSSCPCSRDQSSPTSAPGAPAFDDRSVGSPSAPYDTVYEPPRADDPVRHTFSDAVDRLPDVLASFGASPASGVPTIDADDDDEPAEWEIGSCAKRTAFEAWRSGRSAEDSAETRPSGSAVTVGAPESASAIESSRVGSTMAGKFGSVTGSADDGGAECGAQRRPCGGGGGGPGALRQLAVGTGSVRSTTGRPASAGPAVVDAGPRTTAASRRASSVLKKAMRDRSDGDEASAG